jgi:Protein of unknown function (DUF2865)
MQGTLIPHWVWTVGAALLALGALAAPAAAQGYPPSAGQGRNPVCLRLESQLAAVDRGSYDPAKLDQIKRYEDAVAKQQADLDRLNQQARRIGCQGGGFFALFSGQPAQCGGLINRIQQTRANIDNLTSELQRLQGNSGEREGQRRAILAALGQSDCGPQYRQYANVGPGGIFESLFGGQSGNSSGPLSDTYRTLCVRTCDGFYFPISYSTVPGKFADDENLCRRLCPATEVVLFSYRNPGEDVSRATDVNGRVYSNLPNAFAYRKQYNAACSCRAPGQSWAQALRQFDDHTLERGDIVVTEEQAKRLSQPRLDAQGKPVRLDPNPAKTPSGPAPKPAAAAPKNGKAAAAPAAPPAEPAAEGTPAGKRKVRTVGTPFLPRDEK